MLNFFIEKPYVNVYIRMLFGQRAHAALVPRVRASNMSDVSTERGNLLLHLRGAKATFEDLLARSVDFISVEEKKIFSINL